MQPRSEAGSLVRLVWADKRATLDISEADVV